MDLQPGCSPACRHQHADGHLRVLAGPGTGKTSVIVESVKQSTPVRPTRLVADPHVRAAGCAGTTTTPDIR